MSAEDTAAVAAGEARATADQAKEDAAEATEQAARAERSVDSVWEELMRLSERVASLEALLEAVVSLVVEDDDEEEEEPAAAAAQATEVAPGPEPKTQPQARGETRGAAGESVHRPGLFF